jgi:hypothetical protein
MIVTAQFTIANLWNTLVFINRWVDKENEAFSEYTVDYYSDIEDEILSFAWECMEL